MKTKILILIILISSFAIFPQKLFSGCCFLWGDDGQSTCGENLTLIQCDSICLADSWDHVYYLNDTDFPNGCGCTRYYDPTDSIGTPWGKDATDQVWRFVLVVFGEDESDNCREHHVLWKCGMPG